MPVLPRRVLLSLLGLLAAPGLALAGEFILQPTEVAETKALFGQIESRFVVPARSRIGGTITALDVTEGDEVAAGQIIARIVDEKLELQLAAAEARLAAARSELDNAQTELTRSESLLERGSTTLQAVDRARTTVTVSRNAVTELESSKSVILQQMAEGAVMAPAAGRVLSIPTRLGEVVMAGEAVATIAAGQVFLRLAIPERHANGLTVGDRVAIGEGGRSARGPHRKGLSPDPERTCDRRCGGRRPVQRVRRPAHSGSGPGWNARNACRAAGRNPAQCRTGPRRDRNRRGHPDGLGRARSGHRHARGADG
jgi:biotin carboxyl carrier protein